MSVRRHTYADVYPFDDGLDQLVKQAFSFPRFTEVTAFAGQFMDGPRPTDPVGSAQIDQINLRAGQSGSTFVTNAGYVTIAAANCARMTLLGQECRVLLDVHPHETYGPTQVSERLGLDAATFWSLPSPQDFCHLNNLGFLLRDLDTATYPAGLLVLGTKSTGGAKASHQILDATLLDFGAFLTDKDLFNTMVEKALLANDGELNARLDYYSAIIELKADGVYVTAEVPEQIRESCPEMAIPRNVLGVHATNADADPSLLHSRLEEVVGSGPALHSYFAVVEAGFPDSPDGSSIFYVLVASEAPGGPRSLRLPNHAMVPVLPRGMLHSDLATDAVSRTFCSSARLEDVEFAAAIRSHGMQGASVGRDGKIYRSWLLPAPGAQRDRESALGDRFR